MKYFRIILLTIITTLHLHCGIYGKGVIHSIAFDEYKQKGSNSSFVHYECNEDKVELSPDEIAMLQEVLAFTDSLNKWFFVNIMDSTQFFFRWRSPYDDSSNFEVSGTFPMEYLERTHLPESLMKHTWSTKPDFVEGVGKVERYVNRDSVQLNAVEKQTCNKILRFVASMADSFALKELQRESNLEISTGNRKYDYRPKTFINCDKDEDFVRVFDNWVVHDYALHRHLKQYDKNDPYPYDVLDTKDSTVYMYRIKTNEIIYKPCNLRNAHEMMDSILSKSGTEVNEKTDMVGFHFGLGMWMRNNWGLWSGNSHLTPVMEANAITHPDNMSGFILETYKDYKIHSKNKGKELDSLYAAWKDIECRKE